MAKIMAKQSNSNLWQVFVSVLAGMFGVQTKANLERDFNSSNYKHFIIVGLIMTIALVLAIAYFVQWLVDRQMAQL